MAAITADGPRGTADAGLSEEQAAQRLAARGRPPRPPSSRSYASIVRSNLFTVFNLILAVFGALTLVFADWRDALFLGILVANASIGIGQEVRAKRALDRLALVVAPRATVVRDGVGRAAAVDEVVPGDAVRLQPGDQVVADGELVAAEALRLDESILTGESRAVERGPGDAVRSGAFVVEGTGTYVVTAVGEQSYAHRLLGQARAFRHPRSPLELAVNRLLLGLLVLVAVLGSMLGYALLHHDAPVREAVATATAGVVSMIPEGLVLLVSLTYAVGAVRFTRRGVLAQQLNAIESLASADVICLDKTGTLTEPTLRVVEVAPAPGVERAELTALLGRYAASASARNITLEAIASAFPAEAMPLVAELPFSSRRRCGAQETADGTVVLGAPELFALGALEVAAAEWRDQGRRVLAVGRTADAAAAAPGDGTPALGLVVLAESLRPDARETVAFLQREGVELKVLSGDAPETVASIARDAGLAVDRPLAGADIPDDPDALAGFAEAASVVGRVSPDGKRAFVEALRARGRHVAMVGDGVNDVPALKVARLAIAQGTGSQMAKAVADLVLVDGSFATVPGLIAEGRQALRNLQRVARLYLAKSAFAAFLILTIGITDTAYPLLPRHYTLAATLTIGVPTFFLALAPSEGPWRPARFARRTAEFAIPAGLVVGVGVVASYLFALDDLGFAVEEARTVATTVLVALGLYLVLVLEATGRRRSRIVAAGCAGLALLYAAVLALPWSRAFFDLATPTAAMLAMAAGGAALAAGALFLAGFAPGTRARE